MEILIANFSGFCFGVERAIEIVSETAAKNDCTVTFGPIIHNPQVVAQLEHKGVRVINSAGEVTPDMTVVVRSHGISLHERNQLSINAKQLVDATCPFVLKAHSRAAELSEQCDAVIVLGESDHPEVKGIISYVSGELFVINCVAEAKNLPFRKKYGFLAQTTQNNEIFIKISDILKHKCEELAIAKTICSATDKRQKASIELAAQVEVMVVVGGKNSANTTRLCHLCKEICDKTYHIETEEELSKDMFRGISKVGITAGASTPGDLAAKVREYILEVSR